MQKQIEKQTCHWQGCKKIVYVEQFSELFHVVQFCDFHKKVYRRQSELIKKLDPTKHYSEIANKLYKTDRKKFKQIQHQAEKEIRNES